MPVYRLYIRQKILADSFGTPTFIRIPKIPDSEVHFMPVYRLHIRQKILTDSFDTPTFIGILKIPDSENYFSLVD